MPTPQFCSYFHKIVYQYVKYERKLFLIYFDIGEMDQLTRLL